jgi:hypothetical protein
MPYLNYAPVVHRRNAGPVVVVATMAALFVLICVVTGAVDQVAAAVMVGIIGIGLAAMQPTVAIVGAVFYLAFLGDIRRYIAVNHGLVDKDPLLLVGPAITAALCVIALVRHRLNLRSGLSRLVLAMTAVMAFQIINPLQGGPAVGFAGALFYVVPLLWYWIGNAWVSEEFLETVLRRAILPIAVLAALVGLMQTNYGFLRYQADWIRLTHFSAIAVSSHPRPFAFFVSPAEYANFVMTALVVTIAPLIVGRPRISIIFVPLFIAAVIFFGGRGPVIAALFTTIVLWAVQSRNGTIILGRMILAILVGVGGLVYLAMQAQNLELSDQIQPYVDRQVDGFLRPEESDAGLHGSMFLNGILAGIENPIGYGLGATTSASPGSLGVGGGTEIDLSDMFVDLGAIGGFLYLVIIVIALRGSVATWQIRRSVTVLMGLGVVVSQAGHWLTGGQYSLAALSWLVIGSLERIRVSTVENREVPVPAAALSRARMQRSPTLAHHP